jgi:membrane protein YqaA with SNARE-associated domain
MIMTPAHIVAAVLVTTARSVRRWLFHLGGVGLIPLGLLDNSPFPIPGAMDIATIVLASRQADYWLYYALMATVGSLLGGFLTYRLARKGGKESLERKFSKRRVNKVYKIFERWGFGSIAIPALLPPPVPMVPFLFAAGAMQYPAKKFMTALAIGRAARYTILAYLGARYGRKVTVLIEGNGHMVLLIVILLLVCGAGAGIYFWFRARNGNGTSKANGRKSPKAA